MCAACARFDRNFFNCMLDIYTRIVYKTHVRLTKTHENRIPNTPQYFFFAIFYIIFEIDFLHSSFYAIYVVCEFRLIYTSFKMTCIVEKSAPHFRHTDGFTNY